MIDKNDPESILKAFYKLWIEWVDAGAKSHPVFLRDEGLCYQLELFCAELDLSDYYNINRPMIRDLMHWQFINAGLNSDYPFSVIEGVGLGMEYYSSLKMFYAKECIHNKIHRNPKRVAWAREHAK